MLKASLNDIAFVTFFLNDRIFLRNVSCPFFLWIKTVFPKYYS